MLRSRLKRRITAANKAVIMRQLANMIPAGIPIARCLDILEKNQHEPTSRTVFHKIKMQLMAGHTLHDSLKLHPDWFDTFTCQLVRLGEQTGKLDQVLLTLATHHENTATFRRNIWQALFYPCLILGVAIIMSVCMFIFVIPTFAELFKDITQPLPLLTRILFFLSRALVRTSPFMLALAASMIALLITPQRAKLMNSLLAALRNLPPLTNILNRLAMIHFSRHLAIALAAGIPILEALSLTINMENPVLLTSSIRQLRAALSAGYSLHQAMQSQVIFPLLLQQMVKVGEEAGTLDKMLEKSAVLMEDELNARISHLTKLLEPLIMSVLGVLIGGLVIGMYLPIFNLGSVI